MMYNLNFKILVMMGFIVRDYLVSAYLHQHLEIILVHRDTFVSKVQLDHNGALLEHIKTCLHNQAVKK